jgi:hypothetical protein
MRLTRRSAWIAAAIAIGLYTLIMMLRRFDGMHGLLLASGQPLFGDFLAIWTGGHQALTGHVAQLYDENAARAVQQALIPGFARVVPFYSPPIMLLIAAPLAVLPYAPAAIVYLLATFALYLFATHKLAPDPVLLIFAAALPLVSLHIANLQTGLLVAGLSGLAFYWLDRRPYAAGAAIALLAVKPHLALAWPLLLALRGKWRAFAAAAIGVVALALLAGLLFGFGSYADFLANLKTAQSAVDDARVGANIYASLYANLLMAGAPAAFAMAVHGVSALAALALAGVIWRRADANTSSAALCAATMLLSPYLFYYDATLLALAALMLARDGASRIEQYGFAFAWAAPLLALLVGGFPFCAAAAWGVMALSARRAFAPAPPAGNRP